MSRSKLPVSENWRRKKKKEVHHEISRGACERRKRRLITMKRKMVASLEAKRKNTLEVLRRKVLKRNAALNKLQTKSKAKNQQAQRQKPLMM